MKLKKILRTVLRTVYWFMFGYLVGARFIGGVDTFFVNAALVVGVIIILIYIIKYIYNRKSFSKRYKGLKLLFYYLTKSHKARYYCLIQGDTEKAEEYQEIMDECSNTILKYGPSIMSGKEATKKERKELQEIINETKVLITKIQPPV